MKICPQIYVRGSIEAVEFYKEAFGGTLGFHAKNEDGTYAHADIMMGASVVLALCESEAFTCCENDIPVMQFNVYDIGTEETVQNAYRVLKEGAIRNDNLDGPGPVPWNRYCFSLIDRYNVFWWIAV